MIASIISTSDATMKTIACVIVYVTTSKPTQATGQPAHPPYRRRSRLARGRSADSPVPLASTALLLYAGSLRCPCYSRGTPMKHLAILALCLATLVGLLVAAPLVPEAYAFLFCMGLAGDL